MGVIIGPLGGRSDRRGWTVTTNGLCMVGKGAIVLLGNAVLFAETPALVLGPILSVTTFRKVLYEGDS